MIDFANMPPREPRIYRYQCVACNEVIDYVVELPEHMRTHYDPFHECRGRLMFIDTILRKPSFTNALISDIESDLATRAARRITEGHAMSFGSRTGNAPAAPQAPARSKYGGINTADARDPMLEVGTYRVRVVGGTSSTHPVTRRESVKIKLVVIEAAPDSGSKPGDSVTSLSFLTPRGLIELKLLVMRAAGFGPTLSQLTAPNIADLLKAGEAAYDALDESKGYTGAIVEASLGIANGAPSVAGRLVDVIVSKGKPVPHPQTGAPTGDYFRNYVWGVVPDAEQTAA